MVGSCEPDLELGTIHELDKPVPGMWRVPTNLGRCCIYRVPNCMRNVSPEAYTPQFVLIGPLHHSLKSEALVSRGDITNTKSMDYLNMERHKRFYLTEFAKRLGEGTKSIDVFRRVIEEDEVNIRESYAESTVWINSQEFVEMILHDSVFILEFILRCYNEEGNKKNGDPLMDECCLQFTVKSDLILLENQLPFFILKKLFNLIHDELFGFPSLRRLVTTYFFDSETTIEDDSEFMHFTDLFRCVRVETLPMHFIGNFGYMDEMYNADKLHSGGIEFSVVDKELSMEVEFKNGCLNIPSILVDDSWEMTLRNIMALEQCHYPLSSHVSNYIVFLAYLIDTEKDVDFLVEKGIIKNMLGNHCSVATMVNKLSSGAVIFSSYYSIIANEVRNYYNNPWNKSCGVLKSVYFSNLWRGTATVAAAVILVLTLLQTVPSFIQIFQ